MEVCFIELANTYWMATLYLGCSQHWEHIQILALVEPPFGQGRQMIQKEKKIEQIYSTYITAKRHSTDK